MLDKSVPYFAVIMRRLCLPPPAPARLPKGFVLRAYAPGDEVGWANIETGVLEFETAREALECHARYQRNMEALRARQFLIEAPNGAPVATATAWRQGEVPTVHALGCLPEYQGMGLGRAVAIRMLEAFSALDPGKDVWLDTQTWSWKAVGLYLDLGFLPEKRAVFSKTPNQYREALPILREKMRPAAFQKFLEAAGE